MEATAESKPRKSFLSKKLLLTILLIIFILVGVEGYFIGKKLIKPARTHIHAGFVVFENNQKKDFSADEYMRWRPCGVQGAEQPPETDDDIQQEKAHLHDRIGDVVHSERVGARWRDLFTNIKYPIDYKTTTSYINGYPANDFEDQIIKDYDSLVIFSGKESDFDAGLAQAVTAEQIKVQADKSEDCATGK